MLRITARENEECEQQRRKRQLISIALSISRCRSLWWISSKPQARESSVACSLALTRISPSHSTHFLSLFACARGSIPLLHQHKRACERACFWCSHFERQNHQPHQSSDIMSDNLAGAQPDWQWWQIAAVVVGGVATMAVVGYLASGGKSSQELRSEHHKRAQKGHGVRRTIQLARSRLSRRSLTSLTSMN